MIDIPGYDVIDFRLPREGELYIANDIARPKRAAVSHGHTSPFRLIVRKRFEWPTWLKAKYIAMDECGDWFAYNEAPEPYNTRWSTSDADHILLRDGFFDMQLPTCDDWKQSLMENPHV